MQPLPRAFGSRLKWKVNTCHDKSYFGSRNTSSRHLRRRACELTKGEQLRLVCDLHRLETAWCLAGPRQRPLQVHRASRRSQADPPQGARQGQALFQRAVKSPWCMKGKKHLVEHEQIMQGVTESHVGRFSLSVCKRMGSGCPGDTKIQAFKSLLDERVELFTIYLHTPSLYSLSLSSLPSISQGFKYTRQALHHWDIVLALEKI